MNSTWYRIVCNSYCVKIKKKQINLKTVSFLTKSRRRNSNAVASIGWRSESITKRCRTRVKGVFTLNSAWGVRPTFVATRAPNVQNAKTNAHSSYRRTMPDGRESSCVAPVVVARGVVRQWGNPIRRDPAESAASRPVLNTVVRRSRFHELRCPSG